MWNQPDSMSDMNSRELLQEAQTLGPSEKLWLVEAMWDQIEAESISGFTDAQLAEIRQRDAYFAQHPDETEPASVAVARLRGLTQ
jgi:putative addiction module component (TIGR02574 family)